MELENYRDLSRTGSDVDAGFQYEFYCTNCTRKWKSPFRPYRMGQLSGILMRFTFLFKGGHTAGYTSDGVAAVGSQGARDKSLAEAMRHAETLYTVCGQCNKAVCDDCWHAREQMCVPCVEGEQAQLTQTESAQSNERAGGTCPNCRSPASGGRFCAECGFDMASTHKSCPGCSAMLPRQARFCTDCGHGF